MIHWCHVFFFCIIMILSDNQRVSCLVLKAEPVRRIGESAHLPSVWPGLQFQPGVICGLTLLLVLTLLRGFFSGFSGFLLSALTNISKFQFHQDRGPIRKPSKADVASYINIFIIYLFIYSFIYFIQVSLMNIQQSLTPSTSLPILRKL